MSSISNNVDIMFLLNLKNLIFNIDNNIILETVKEIRKLKPEKFSILFYYIISKLIFSSTKRDYDKLAVYINFIKEYDDETLTKTLIQYLIRVNNCESNYFLNKLLENNIAKVDDVKNIKSLYFMHYKSDEDINKMKNDIDFDEVNNNIEKLKKNNWELHKKLISDGNNPSLIANILREDDINKLQDLSSNDSFDFSGEVEHSIYERHYFVNNFLIVKLIDFAAFFGSIKCFDYLLLNGADINGTGQYAVASGNLEMIHKLEGKEATFEYSHEAAIEYHQNQIFFYLYNNKIGKNIPSDLELIQKCIECDNYEILIFLLEKYEGSYSDLIKTSLQNGNIYLYNYFKVQGKIPKDMLPYSIRPGNLELVKNFIDIKGIDINAKNVLLNVLIFYYLT